MTRLRYLLLRPNPASILFLTITERGPACKPCLGTPWTNGQVEAACPFGNKHMGWRKAYLQPQRAGLDNMGIG